MLQFLRSIFAPHKSEIERLTKLAYYDTLTELPNRLLFHQTSNELMKHAEQANEPLTVFLIDLDNFKNINDTHGHAIGDLLLKQVASRLNAISTARCAIAKSVHSNYQAHVCDCLVSRLGGDEFVMLFEHMDRHEAEIVAMQTIATLKEPVSFKTSNKDVANELTVSASLGVSIYPWDGSDISTLLKSADLAMYAAKDRGKDQFAFHETSMNTKIERRAEAELMIREIIATGIIELYFQPVFNLDDNMIVGFESLLRGNKSKSRIFHPMELISVAEESNLIIPLGTLILEKACEFACQCLDGGFDLLVSINVSSPQLMDPNFVNIVHGILEKTGLPPTNLILEITETMLMVNFDRSAETLQRLRDLGVIISIDDFGKGYSSFNYLQSLPISKLKIDMSFIQSLGTDKKSDEIVKGIILLADALGMDTCAEGVETQHQLKKLKEFGCTRAQGHIRYPALNRKDFLQMLETENVVRF